MTATHTAATALPLITQWEAANADNPEACIWNDLLYDLPGVSQELSDNEVIAFTDGSRLEWSRDGWDAYPPEGGTPGTAEQLIDEQRTSDGAAITTILRVVTDGNHFDAEEVYETDYAGSIIRTTRSFVESGWSDNTAAQLLSRVLDGYDLDGQEG